MLEVEPTGHWSDRAVGPIFKVELNPRPCIRTSQWAVRQRPSVCVRVDIAVITHTHTHTQGRETDRQRERGLEVSSDVASSLTDTSNCRFITAG